MMISRFAAAAALLLAHTLPGLAHEGIHIHDPYARIIAGSGVVYFQIENMETGPDTLIAAKSPLGMAMLMNSAADENGVMKMRMVDGGFTVGAGERRQLSAAADHVMLSDVAGKPKNGDTFVLTLTFEKAGDIAVTVPVDNGRRTDPGDGPTAFDAMSTPLPASN